MYIWTTLSLVALILLAKYWYGTRKNAVWGGFTIGILIGVLWKFIGGTDWYIVIKVASVSTLLGFAAELLGIISDHLKKKGRK